MRILAYVPLLSFASAVHAQGAPPALPPIRQLGSPVAASGAAYRSPTVVRPLRGGRVLVNDVTLHRLTIVDSLLKPVEIVADSAVGATLAYGGGLGGLLPFPGDSSLFVEMVTPAIYVIDPEGKPARMMSVPSPRDANRLLQSSRAPWASSDAQGRIIFAGSAPRTPDTTVPKPGEFLPFSFPDSASIQRMDAVTRQVETLGWYKTLKLAGQKTSRADGRTMSYMTSDPLPIVEDFAVLSDGTIAILRGDFHFDLIAPDGKKASSPRIPYPWIRYSDSAKVALIDSLKRKLAAADTAKAPVTLGNRPAAAASGGGSTGSSPMTSGFAKPENIFVAPSEMSDYAPAFGSGAVKADAHGNAWIRTLMPASSAAKAIYFVVTPQGKVIDRVELPADRTVIGFDSASIYLSARGDDGTWLERVRIAR